MHMACLAKVNNLSTVEPRLTTTSEKRSYKYNGQMPCPDSNYTCLPEERPPRYRI